MRLLYAVISLMGLGMALAQQTGKPIPFQRPSVAVAEFKPDGVPPTVARQLRSAMESALLESKRYRVLTRELDAALKERALAQAGVTERNAQDVGKFTKADLIVFGEIGADGQQLSIVAKIMRVSDGLLLHSIPRELARSELGVFAQEFVQGLWSREPVRANLSSWKSDGTGLLDAGLEAGLRDGLEGSLWRIVSVGNSTDRRRIGSIEIVSAGLSTSDIRYTLNNGIQLALGDRLVADVGYLQRLDQETQSVWYRPSSRVFEVSVLNASTGKRFENRSQVRLGEKVQVKFKIPIPGYVYIVSVFPGDQQFNLLFASANLLSAGQEIAFPKASDPFELVAQPPVGPSLLKVYILPNAIPELNSSSGLGAREIAALRQAVEQAGNNWASGELLVEIVK